MTIDPDTGCIALPELGASIAASLSRSAFLKMPAFSGAAILQRNEPWCSYRLPELPQGDTQLCIVLQFLDERLCWLNLTHTAPRFGTSWAEFSEQRELERKAFHEKWLREKFGLWPAEYPWGKIASEYDPKGGGSSITIRYAERDEDEEEE